MTDHRSLPPGNEYYCPEYNAAVHLVKHREDGDSGHHCPLCSEDVEVGR